MLMYTNFSVLRVLKLNICANLPYHSFLSSEGLLNAVGRNDERFRKTKWTGRTGQKELGKDKNFDSG